MSNITFDLQQLLIPIGQYILLQDVTWERYEIILTAQGERDVGRSSRIAFCDEVLEIMVPLPEHEYLKRRIGSLIEDLLEELNIEFEGFGSTTWRRQQKMAGAEPDECFYIHNFAAVRGKIDIDLQRDPPPDLVLEIDITSRSLDRLTIYARLGVPEVWRVNQNQLRIYQLQDDYYEETESSLAFPNFPVKMLPNFVQSYQSGGRIALRQAFRKWVRNWLNTNSLS
ncbi:MAG: Uma2 family endonuclease [Chroococcidiopsidaceae cyanobacterium CP_BM_ER_R8_30]|nr:Uma2 family endonuclease [Chroococcidiopsidaceae cyanobacterium CP_BM_ER_R8_30]